MTRRPATHARERLATGPARGLGCTHQIVAEALRSPDTVKELVEALTLKYGTGPIDHEDEE